jgi:hypothetical protein
MIDWLETIPNESWDLTSRKNILVSGGCIHHCFKDYQLTTTTYTFRTWMFWSDWLSIITQTTTTGVDKVLTEENVRTILTIYIDDNESEEAVRYKTLKLDQVKLNISSIEWKKELIEGKKYQVAFFSQNAISEDLQIVLRFSGNVTQIHKTFDFVHATNFHLWGRISYKRSSTRKHIDKVFEIPGSLYLPL